ncbi:electron transfer flavoprotein subunit alpha/FixB family protein [Nitrincola tibetensis]|uniref:Electron transfer flavoprotein subunit alpha n=1 Tax=Nitrincola tibetensis TaxID=2219697 RepID=A0A364NKS6_9GAMM|nr:FAD-binding protein [Nitrincola tibetensis]RAU17475.1 electron transfer flavoprotein subunit alpha/FixB family protein [Nitrincola tibetensis]
MSILVLAEHDNQSLKPVTLSVIAAAKAIGADVTLLVAGHQCGEVAEQAAQVVGVQKVLLADAPAYAHQLAENVSQLLLEQAQGCSHVLAAATTTGKNVLPRVAALLGVNQVSDVLAIEAPNRFKRAIYAGNAIAQVESDESVQVLTIRGTAFDPVAATGNSATIERVDSVFESADVSFSHEALAKSDRPELTAASIVVSGGRGLGNGENFDMLYKVADKLGAAVGASRAAVDAGYVPNDMQVGQTGKLVAPELYIAVGISGAIQHLAGMKDSKVIVAINKDEEAPIFQVADYGLVADLFEAVPELENAIS